MSPTLRARLRELERDNRELRAALKDGDYQALEVEDQRRAQRLAATFETLASLTHEINNPLTSLIGRTQLLRMTGVADHETLKAMAVIEESSQRIAECVRDLADAVKNGRESELGDA